MGKWMKICFGYEFEGFRSKNEKGWKKSWDFYEVRKM